MLENLPGAANGRALAYLAHLYLGDVFGTLYDPEHDLDTLVCRIVCARGSAQHRSTVPAAIWNGAGMGTRYTSARGRVYCDLFYRDDSVRADVDAQGGAYATGVLALMTSAAIAVTLSPRVGWDKVCNGCSC
jgi:hypothetical protein